jgi:hypothetical protein
VDVRPIDPTSETAPAAPDGTDSTVLVATSTGANFFHTIATLPAHLLEEIEGETRVVFGRYLNTTIDGPAEDAPADTPTETPTS